ncbi:hypothetical protein TTHERM_00442780 (macronuclear) [Tetrahymena thermophila SB210]|uniref:Uncharacterized protein n=1 Tax=Tetrahymena thermophila (strain SB210) TaxID=312017 RepID=I7LTM7_TETTS|nr:hypothetical protein TTHERM_00442780 [Tetrahymena thermophila SB210]EAR85528.2 hypothetical protein TTHERM_00442780 [Tetrahymena thermophila SB210]|eukprot:XP_001033191.2 hypothetical protein TTHERM_00442780 [Tetrahymena thermophila SB210]
MKILIVNAYSDTPSGQKQFSEFENMIKQYFLRQKDLMDTETEFFVCDKNNICDFLYEMSGSFVSKEAAKSFDFIDMVFIEGDANLRPWSDKASQFLMFLKNCFKTNKILWASQFAMQALIYLIATDLERPVNIVNGANGDPIQSFKSIQKDYPNGKMDYFLDNVSGDMYQWDNEINQWKPVHNTGLHFRKKAQESQDLGKLVMKTEIYRANIHHKKTYTIFEAKNTETICYIKKALMNHYALLDLEFEFLVPSKNQWDAHPIAFVNPQKTYTVLADSRFTVQIIEPNPYTLGCQFNVTKKYPQTVQVLCNFIKHQLDKIRQGKRSIPIKSIVNMTEEDNNSLESILKAKKQDSQQEEQKKKKIYPCFRHSGFAIKKHDKVDLMVENNAVHRDSVTNLQEIDHFNSRSSKSGIGTNNNIPSLNNINIEDQHSQVNSSKQHRPMTAFQNGSSKFQRGNEQNIKSIMKNRIISAKSTVQSQFISTSQYQKFQDASKQSKEQEHKYNQKDLIDEKDAFVKNQSEIRLMLHPKLQKEGLPQNENIWVSGSNFQKDLSKSNQLSGIRALEHQTIIKVPSVGPMKKLQLRTQSAASLKQQPLYTTQDKNHNPFVKQENVVMPSRVNLQSSYFGTKSQLSIAETDKKKTTINNLDIGFDECRKKPIVRTSGPYLTVQEQEQLRELEAKKLNIGDRIFHTGSVKNYKMLKNILFDSEYNPPSKHQYREFNPEKWVSKNAFLL